MLPGRKEVFKLSLTFVTAPSGIHKLHGGNEQADLEQVSLQYPLDRLQDVGNRLSYMKLIVSPAVQAQAIQIPKKRGHRPPISPMREGD